MRRLPPLSAVEAFVTTAETGSLRSAANALSLSPSAVTRRIQLFERCAGAEMFERHSDGVTLTDRGRQMLGRLGSALGALKSAIEEDEDVEPIRVRVSRSVAALWLVPRLALRGLPHKVHFVSDITMADLRDGRADIGIFHGDNAAEGLVSDALIPLHVSAVAAPGYLKDPEIARDNTPRVLGLVQQEGIWRSLAPGAVEVLRFDGIHAMFEAAASGAGVALGVAPLVNPYLADGRLVELPQFGKRRAGVYNLVVTRRALQRWSVARFRDWLLEEAVA
jgi:LysR family transcriptional regulator, glycine cleavage system transcriptional activator